MSDWMFGMCPHDLFFDTWEQVRAYVKHVDSDPQVETYGRWLFFDLSEQIEETANVN